MIKRFKSKRKSQGEFGFLSTILLTVASGSFGTIYRGSYKLTNGGKYTIALKTIRLDVEKGREKDRERLELLKVFFI